MFSCWFFSSCVFVLSFVCTVLFALCCRVRCCGAIVVFVVCVLRCMSGVVLLMCYCCCVWVVLGWEWDCVL